MTDILVITWQALGSLLNSTVSMFTVLLQWIFSVFLILHNDMPRIEGLLLGVLFAWFFVHRDKNPVVRAMAVPLKILLDILDIIWNETTEAVVDLYGTGKNHVVNASMKLKNFITGMFSGIITKLMSVKDKLKAKIKK